MRFSLKSAGRRGYALCEAEARRILPAVISAASRMRLRQHGANTMPNSKIYETTPAAEITKRMMSDILRKYRNSFFERGFSGVSKGQNNAIGTADAAETQASATVKS